MVFAVTVKGKLSYKQDVSSVETLLADQESTYAVMRYCTEIPSGNYSYAMKQLSCEADRITYRKLRDLVKKFIKASGCVIVMDEELESSIFVDPKTGKILTEDQIELIDDVPHIKDTGEKGQLIMEEDEEETGIVSQLFLACENGIEDELSDEPDNRRAYLNIPDNSDYPATAGGRPMCDCCY